MKPSWTNSPDWAKWLAQDRSGKWWWFEEEPMYMDYDGKWAVKDFGLSRVRIAHEVDDSSRDSLELRPV
jgi:hypothetical protein